MPATAGGGTTINYNYDGNAQLRTVTLPNSSQVISYDNYN